MLVLLAASGLSERELREGISALDLRSPEEVVRLVMELRRESKNLIDKHLRPRSHHHLDYPQDEPGSSDTIFRVEELLRSEAHMTVKEAALELIESLEKRHGGLPLLPPPSTSKRSFRSWLRTLLRHISERELLHIATVIRNSRVHSAPGDWPLRDH